MLTAASQDEPARHDRATRWDPILEEFCDFLNEKYGAFLRTALRNGAAPHVRHLKLWPRGQRNVQSSILSVYVTDDSARVLGDTTPELKTEMELQQWLTSFLRLPSFRSSLEELREIASQPVMGVLRVSADRKAGSLLADVTVKVPSDQQYRLADAAEATPVQRIEQFYVEPAGRTLLGRGTYTAETKPIWLVAGGYALEIEPGSDAQEGDGRIRLNGTPVPARDLD
jgi:hypothetical protein